MSEGTLHGEHYEFFSWRGFGVGASIISVSMLVQSSIGFPDVWTKSPVTYLILIATSALVVGISSGAVLVYLVAPNQDVIGLSGLKMTVAPIKLCFEACILVLLSADIVGLYAVH